MIAAQYAAMAEDAETMARMLEDTKPDAERVSLEDAIAHNRRRETCRLLWEASRRLSQLAGEPVEAAQQ